MADTAAIPDVLLTIAVVLLVIAVVFAVVAKSPNARVEYTSMSLTTTAGKLNCFVEVYTSFARLTSRPNCR